MSKVASLFLAFLFTTALVATGCHKRAPTLTDASLTSTSAGTAPSVGANAELPMGVRVPRLHITNACSYDVWIQQQGLPAPAVTVRRVRSGETLGYEIPAAGLASTRFWAKKGCDATGESCTMGQSSPPCPAIGCAPPVDSKLEVTWGCTLSDKKLCGKTPQGVSMIDTFWNSSGVDGFTFPFTVKTVGGDARKSCVPVDCSALDLKSCPTDDDLSNKGANPTYAHQNENVVAPDAGVSDAAASSAGCFATCTKLNYPGWGGDGLNAPAGTIESMYCCPTPPVSAVACQAGPVPTTKYVTLIHTACKSTSYGYAYDDGLGARTCSGDTVLEMTIGPNCP